MEVYKPFVKPVYVTQPLLPDIKDVNEMIETIWESNVLSNNGNMVKQLESELAGYLNVSYLSLFSNGTVALQLLSTHLHGIILNLFFAILRMILLI
jgi:dTDP-4-amino-4,6-dideoxygalactose transaminase